MFGLLRGHAKNASATPAPTDQDVDASNQAMMNQMRQSQIDNNNTSIATSQMNTQTNEMGAENQAATQRQNTLANSIVAASNASAGTLAKLTVS